jgi:hypothetical protein
MRGIDLLLGLVLLHVLVVLAGAALLMALGCVERRPRALALALGPAFFCGVALLGPPLILLLVLGVHVDRFLMIAVAVGATLALGAVALWRWEIRPVVEVTPPASRIEVLLSRVTIGLVAAYLVFGLSGLINLSTSFDDANIWSLRGLGIYSHGELASEIFRNPDFSYVHLDYPILQPVLEAGFFQAIGGVDLRLWHAELWTVFVSGIWTLAWLLTGRGGSFAWVAPIAVIALTNIGYGNVTLADADATLAIFIGCAALTLGIWIEGGLCRHAILGAVLLGAAVNVKNEGLVFAFAVVVAAAAATLGRRSPARRRDLAVVAGVVVACALPWQIYVAGNEAASHATVEPWRFLSDPGFFIDRLDFFWRGLGQVARRLVETSSWGLMVPAFIVVAFALVRDGRERPVAVFYLLAWLLAALGVGYSYWVTPIGDIVGFEERTGPRLVLGVALIAGAGLAHLLQIAFSGRGVMGGDAPSPSAPGGRAGAAASGSDRCSTAAAG